MMADLGLIWRARDLLPTAIQRTHRILVKALISELIAPVLVPVTAHGRFMLLNHNSIHQ